MKKKSEIIMRIQDILATVDHTLLATTATKEQIIALCEEAIQYKTASVCIPPCYVALAKAHLEGRVNVCTVIGFPNGYQSTAVKVFETEDAVRNGADEIDMVINIGWLKTGRDEDVLAEIKAIKAACGEKILKVIIETALLTEEEKIKLCEVVSNSRADYIKTSTGFAGGGATREDVALLVKHMTNGKKVKASGGIATLEDAEAFLTLGADRLGTSRVVKAVKAMENNA